MMKERCSKKRIHVIDNTKETSTLDDIHLNNIKKYKEIDIQCKAIQTDIDNLAHISKNLVNLINTYDDISCSEVRTLWNSNLDIKESIINKKEELSKIENQNDTTYYENIGKILYEYYDTVNNNDESSVVEENNKYTILNALMKNKEKQTVSNNDKNSIGKKTRLVNEYLSLTDNKYINYKDREFIDEKCQNCHEGSMISLQAEAISICVKCGHQEILLAEQNRPIMIHDKKDNSHYSYKRINHFREWCNQVQGKESTDIPDEVFEKILNELKKEKITDTTKLTPKQMKAILKKIRTHKYYEHAAYIINRINGVPPPQFSPELEQTLSNMFMQTQPLFIKYAPANRLNFISYSYILHKFFLCLGMEDYAKLFPLLKSRTKISTNEEIFKKICNDLNWKFVPSI